VVIKNVIDSAEIEKGIALFKTQFRQLLGLKKELNDWPDVHFPTVNNGMVLDGDIHRSRFAWFSRSRPKVLQVYKSLYQLGSSH
jgi:hypothetical protein